MGPGRAAGPRGTPGSGAGHAPGVLVQLGELLVCPAVRLEVDTQVAKVQDLSTVSVVRGHGGGVRTHQARGLVGQGLRHQEHRHRERWRCTWGMACSSTPVKPSSKVSAAIPRGRRPLRSRRATASPAGRRCDAGRTSGVPGELVGPHRQRRLPGGVDGVVAEDGHAGSVGQGLGGVATVASNAGSRPPAPGPGGCRRG